MFEKLSQEQLARRQGRGANPEYVQFLQTLGMGDGGRVSVAQAGVTRQSVKARLQRAARQLGLEISFLRSGGDEVLFTVNQPGESGRRRRGRPPKKASE
jgi:hypothetical protein